MRHFVHTGLPSRVVFGRGTLAEVPAELARLGVARPLVLATQPARAEALAARIGAAGAFGGAVMHTPVEVTERATALARDLGADGLVALGGGSAIGLGKAIALRTGLPQLAIPTTYAGSEMTTILGETEGGAKRTQRSPRVLPEVVVYDPDLTAGLPAAITATSGMNAIAHAVETLYAVDASPITDIMAAEAVRAMAAALPGAVQDKAAAREEALYGAWLCGACLGMVSMAIHHKLCHVLGGSFGLPHAETHTVILPHATAYNRDHAPRAMAAIARGLGAAEAAGGLFDLAASLGAPLSLRALGLREQDLDRAAEIAAREPYANPKPIEREAIRALLADAFWGRRPE
jgi:alcohol dehydrogenase class IV